MTIVIEVGRLLIEFGTSRHSRTLTPPPRTIPTGKLPTSSDGDAYEAYIESAGEYYLGGS